MTPFEKSESAKRIREEPVIKQAFIDIRENLVRQLENVPIDDRDTQHETALLLQLLKRLETQLNKYVQDQLMVERRASQDAAIERRRESLAKREASKLK
jgi:hypothetical protein